MSIPGRSRRIAAAALLLLWQAGAAQALTVLAPASLVPGAKALGAIYTRKTGVPVTVTGGSRAAVIQAVRAGQGDVVLLPSTDFADLAQAAGMQPLGRVAIGVAVKADAPVPDISTMEKFDRVLLKAKGVAYADPAQGTSAGRTIAALLAVPELKAVHRVPVPGLAATALTGGTADIALQLAPELMHDPAVRYAGPIPDAFGAGVDFSAGLASGSLDAATAGDFISFLLSPAAAPIWKANGLESLNK